jgi:hypothetical protein
MGLGLAAELDARHHGQPWSSTVAWSLETRRDEARPGRADPCVRLAARGYRREARGTDVVATAVSSM